MCSLFVSESLFSFFNEVHLDTLAGEETDDGFLALSDNEDVTNSSAEGVSVGVLDMDDVKAAGVLFDVLDDTNSTDVVTSSDDN